MLRLIACILQLSLTLAAFAYPNTMQPQNVMPQPEPVGPLLSSLHGTHLDSGTEYLRLFLIPAIPSSSSASPVSRPTFTVECTQRSGKRVLSMYVNYGGVTDYSFPIPFKRTDTDLFPPSNPTVSLEMSFTGYMASKPFKREWEQLPNGNLKYRNPGGGTSNLEPPEFFLRYMRSLPQLHIGHAKKGPQNGKDKPVVAVFDTQSLLEQIRLSPLCNP
ncbi:MAG TPA: hypothetical protein VGM02_10070 [Acidobacteriaceae bacterium]|jgi:hypothetical protein